MSLPPADGFLARWSRRKALVREGQVLPESPPEAPPAPADTAVVPQWAGSAVAAAGLPAASEAAAVSPLVAERSPAPTLDDVARLTPQDDFSRFVATDVDSTVRNAALKTLFSDPHFNVMDGLDTYIEDYGLPDPIPPAMLRQLVQGEFLGLFKEEREAERQALAKQAAERLAPPAATIASAEATPAAAAVAETAAAAGVTDANPHTPPESPSPPAPSDRPTSGAALPPPDAPQGMPHEDADLRLQPDHAAGRPGAGPGPGEHAGR